MTELEAFFTAYKNTAWAFFSFIGFMFVVIKVFMIARNLYITHITKAVNDALLDQRQEFQAQLFDIQEKRHTDYCKAMVDFAIDAAIVRKILEDNNIKAFEAKK